ncbi:MAG: redoxin domain-containing protein, partial [Candidatus Ranarchaeia archaeon]
FTLTDPDLKKVGLKELLISKKVLIAFFPGAFTNVCTKELCTLRDSISKFGELNAEIVAISVNDPFTNKAFSSQNKLPFPVLSDYTREVIRRYGVVHEDFAGLLGYTAAKRAVFIVDQEGIIRYRWVTEDPTVEPPYEKIEYALEKI